MKKIKALIFTAVLVVGFTSVAGAASAYDNRPGGNGSCLLTGPCLETP